MLNKVENFSNLKNGHAISIWAILFSTTFYISIFFFFNIHIVTIINTTKFWFLISNTLVVIIAADFGAFFSTTTNEQDLYEDYVKKTHARDVPSFEHHYMRNNTQIKTPGKRPEEHIKHVVIDENVVSKDLNSDVIIECDSIIKQTWEENVEGTQEEEKASKFDRNCYSMKGRIMDEDEEKEIVLRRSKSERHAPEEEENEFSTMSVEELNRRVEEFIQRFNQDIRLQAAKNSHNSKKFVPC